MRQSAADSSCDPEDFRADRNKVVISRKNPAARRYLELPFLCDLTSYGSNIVASVSPQFAEPAAEYIGRFEVPHCFETPNLHVLSAMLRPLGCDICFMAEYFLPEPDALRRENCGFEIRILGPGEFAEYYLPQWSNALCKERRSLDRIAAGAFDRGRLVGLAGASADCGSMWQIGVDVAPEFRRRGIASCLTGILAAEILERGIVPFYCCAWSNIGSARNAIRSGFRPAWVQVTAKTIAFIDGLNAAAAGREVRAGNMEKVRR